MKKIVEIRAINGPYPPTVDGVERALEACLYDQELGKRPENSEVVVVFDDGSQRCFSAQARGFGTEAYAAAEIAHELDLEHDRGICHSCALEDELEELEDLKDKCGL